MPRHPDEPLPVGPCGKTWNGPPSVSFIGEEEDSAVLHHLCRNRWCRNREHLVIISRATHAAWHRCDDIWEERKLEALKIPEELRELRRRMGWSHADMADVVCASERSVIRWESGEAIPRTLVRRHFRLLLDTARRRDATKKARRQISAVR